MSFNGPEALLERMAQVGVAPLDKQSLANSLDLGFEVSSLAGRLPGRETLISDTLASVLPDAEPAPSMDIKSGYDFTAKLPGLE